MFETLFYDEEGLLILNLEEIRADFISRKYHENPYGKVFVTCPSGCYSLFAYLSRIAGMKGAREALEKFQAEKLAALDRECYTTKKLKNQQEFEDLLRRSYYYYYYADADMIKSTDDFLSAFQDTVYDGQYDYDAFCEGVREDVRENAEAWETEQKAFAYAINRMQRGEACDAAEAARMAVDVVAPMVGTTGMTDQELADMVYNVGTGEYCIACLDIVNEKYAVPGLVPVPRNNPSRICTTRYFNKDHRRMVADFWVSEAEAAIASAEAVSSARTGLLKTLLNGFYAGRREVQPQSQAQFRDLNSMGHDLDF